MKKKLVAIGGGENGRLLENGKYAPYQTEQMDLEIIKLTEKKQPNFLFIGHGMHFSLDIQENYYETMKKIYGNKFKCKCRHLKSIELHNIEKIKAYIDWADIIYEGGGDTQGMITLWKETGFDKYLYEAWLNGKVICGVSAGAVCWFNSCNSDSTNKDVKNRFCNVDCLKWIPMHLTPHCEELGRYESTKIQLKENGLVGIMLSNCSAIEIVDEQFKFISSDSNAYVVKSFWKDDKYFEKKWEISDNFANIKELLEKN